MVQQVVSRQESRIYDNKVASLKHHSPRDLHISLSYRKDCDQISVNRALALSKLKYAPSRSLATSPLVRIRVSRLPETTLA